VLRSKRWLATNHSRALSTRLARSGRTVTLWEAGNKTHFRKNQSSFFHFGFVPKAKENLFQEFFRVAASTETGIIVVTWLCNQKIIVLTKLLRVEGKRPLGRVRLIFPTPPYEPADAINERARCYHPHGNEWKHPPC